MTEHCLKCHCGDDREHLITFKFYDQDKDWNDFVIANAALNHYLPWYKRVPIALKYLFGIDNTHCHYVESIYDKATMVKLQTWINEVIPQMVDDKK